MTEHQHFTCDQIRPENVVIRTEKRDFNNFSDVQMYIVRFIILHYYTVSFTVHIVRKVVTSKCRIQ